ncbi:hypothetical protein LTR56_025362 [Elasticomyces elasticus]|nr:hypothetical protein LTR56_025362 [Elasticomyces elasticus]KAK5748828.1 hypothetical protein LTS12_021125 [Elasticomyces elasticus]
MFKHEYRRQIDEGVRTYETLNLISKSESDRYDKRGYMIVEKPIDAEDSGDEELDRESLRAFRFVCRTITSAINDTYIRRLYKHRTYLATPYGVQSFVEDTEQDDRATYLRCITFAAPGIKPVNQNSSRDRARRRKKADAKGLLRARFDEI